MDNNLSEKLAAYSHQAWSNWMRYMFSKCNSGLPHVLSALNNDSLIIPASLVKHWSRQMNTEYKDLPENEKESNRQEADRMIKIIED